MISGRRRVAHVALVAAALAIVATPREARSTPTQPGELVNDMLPPTNCVFCHDFDNPAMAAADPEYSPVRSWQGTMMANASRDPVFWAGLGVADMDAPGETILCVRCHSPRAFLEGNGNATTIDQLTVDQRSGVECELCHRAMEDVGVAPGNAQYTVDDVLVADVVPRRGPWDYTDGVPEPLHDWLHDPYIGTSRLCGTCHDVTTTAERVDDAGVGLGVPFNEQRTYSEWLGSAYAQPGADFASCQDCHLPEVPDMAACFQNTAAGQTHPVGGRRHDLLGANTFMLELLKSEYGSAGTNEVQDLYYDGAIAKSADFLATAATVELQGPAQVDLGEGLAGLGVTVTNNTGHKLPSGYSEGRVMWLEVLASYDGEVVYSSGAWDQVAGMQADDQLRTYQAVAEQYATGTEFHLLLNDHWVEDTRIPPLGLQPNLETDPVTDRYVLQGDGTWPNFDTHAYDFGPLTELADATPGDPDDDVLQVTVRLRYLINTPEYIDFLGGSGTEAGNHVGVLFDLAGGAVPQILTEATLEIPIVGFGAEAETSGGSETSTTSGGDAGTTSGATTNADDSTTSGATTLPPPDGTSGPGDASSSETDDAGASSDGGDDGCGCRSGGSGRGRGPIAGWLGLALLGLSTRRRRRLGGPNARPAAHRRP